MTVLVDTRRFYKFISPKMEPIGKRGSQDIRIKRTEGEGAVRCGGGQGVEGMPNSVLE